MKTNYLLKKITELYVFLSEGEYGEGIVGQTCNIQGQDVFMPFVCADKDRMECLKPLAKEIANESGKKVKLVRFSIREDLEEYEP